MLQAPTNRKCLFCDSAADSREHVIAEWLSKRMRIRNRKFKLATVNRLTGIRAHGPLTPEKFRTRQVCSECNNGWMSRLEGEFQKSVGFLVEPTWPKLAHEMIVHLRQDAEMLIRWMIKTAVVFEKSIPKLNKPIIPDNVRTMARVGPISQDFFLALGRIEKQDFDAKLEKEFPVWNGGVYHERQFHIDGFSFAVYLNYLALRLVRCPDASVGVKSQVSTLDKIPIVPFWVVPSHFNYDCKVSHVFPTFGWFMDGVEIYTGKPRDPLPPAN